jgi:hypothetical protein
MDGTKLGVTTAKLIEKIEDSYGIDCELGEVLVLAEVRLPRDPDDAPDTECSVVEFYCSTPNSIIRTGLVAVAFRAEVWGDAVEDE